MAVSTVLSHRTSPGKINLAGISAGNELKCISIRYNYRDFFNRVFLDEIYRGRYARRQEAETGLKAAPAKDWMAF